MIKFFLNTVGEKFLIGFPYSCTDRKDYSYLCMWMTSNWLEKKKKISIRCGMYSTKKSIWENQHHSLIMSTWDVLKDIAKHANILLTIAEPCSNPGFPQEQRKKYQARKIRMFLHGLMTWLVMPRNVWKYIANWRTKLLNNCTK